MYETEANQRIESLAGIPDEVLAAFAEGKGKVRKRTTLSWSEHCTECVWPTCYSTCDLYEPREDGRCRRFTDGMVRINCSASINSYLLRIRFKRWGKLWSPGNIRLCSLSQAARVESTDYRIGRTLYQLSVPSPVKRFLTHKRYAYKKKRAGQPDRSSQLPTAFVLECYNPESKTVRLSLTLRSNNLELKVPFQKLINLSPGFQRVRVPIGEIARVIDLGQEFNIELIPNDVETETTLYFGLIDFVEEIQNDQKLKKIKCIVWDLDNTLWHGTLVEDGADNLQLKAGIREVIRDLDSRGILQSVASKNNLGEALNVVRHFGLEQYFLYPQISWQPKSESIKSVARELNIGLDTLLFVDDSQFELEQVKSLCPGVCVLDSSRYLELPQMEECQGPVTDESRERRKMYQVEAQRQEHAQVFGADYFAFLRDCQIKLFLEPMKEENLERVHELTQRTNQMNFSGNRYDRDMLKTILGTRFLDTYVLSCTDRFGSYGVIGFCVVDSREPRMTDLMFSCRVQSKRVEHAFLSHLLRRYIHASGKDFYANYRRTPRNAPSGRVFADLGLEELQTEEGVTSLVFRKSRQIPDDQFIEVTLMESLASA